MAFRFAGTPEGVLCVLSGMTYMEHLQDNLKTYSPLIPLDGNELAFLEETAELMLKYPTIPCNDCKYCMPCPYGVDIPGIFAHYNRCINEGNVPQSSQDENYREARRAFLIGYDRSVPPPSPGKPLHRLRPMQPALPARHRHPGETTGDRPVCGSAEAGNPLTELSSTSVFFSKITNHMPILLFV